MKSLKKVTKTGGYPNRKNRDQTIKYNFWAYDGNK